MQAAVQAYSFADFKTQCKAGFTARRKAIAAGSMHTSPFRGCTAHLTARTPAKKVAIENICSVLKQFVVISVICVPWRNRLQGAVFSEALISSMKCAFLFAFQPLRFPA